jgi:hypothetical protein
VENQNNNQTYKYRSISKTKYILIEKRFKVIEKDSIFIGCVEIIPLKSKEKISLFELCASICIQENLKAADFFVKSYGTGNNNNSVFRWSISLEKMTYFGTIDALKRDENWKNELCKEDFKSPFLIK